VGEGSPFFLFLIFENREVVRREPINVRRVKEQKANSKINL